MISVILPAYNRENTIERAAHSVLNQSFIDLELIIVDDCSTDDTRDVVENINDSRVRYICHEKNQGACVARNTGIMAAKGNYIAFQDSDDEWHLDKLEKQIACLERNNGDICVCQMNRHDYSGNKNGVFPTYDDEIIPYEKLFTGFYISTQMIIAKRDVFDDNMFDPAVKRFQDFDWVIRAALGRTLCVVIEPLVDVYLSNDSLTHSAQGKTEEMFRYFLKKYQYLYREYPQLKIFLKQNLADFMTLHGGKNESVLYKEIYEDSGNRRDLARYILSKLKLLKLYYSLREKF